MVMGTLVEELLISCKINILGFLMNNVKNKYKKLGENTFWMLVGNFATKLLSFFMVPLYTAYLTTSDYGTADLMTTTVSLLSPILTVAASEGVLRFALNKQYDDRQVFTLSLVVSGIGLCILLFLSPILVNYVAFKDFYFLFLIYYIFYNLLWIIQQYSKGINDVKGYAISGFLSTVGSVFSNIFFLTIMKIGIKGYLYAQIAACIVPVTYLFFKDKIYIKITNPKYISKKLIQNYLLYCLPLIPNQLSWWINNSSDKYILNYYWGLAFTGIYSVAYKIPTILNVIGGIFASSWQISSVDNFGSNESKQFYSVIYQKYFSIFACVSALIILFIKILAHVLFAKDFYNAWPYAAILVLASLMQAMGQFYESIYICALKPTSLLLTTIFAAILNTFFNFLLIPKYGAYGAAIATCIGYGTMLLVRIVDSKRIFEFKVKHSRILLTIVCLVAETFVICSNVNKWIIINFFISVMILFLNRAIFNDIIKTIKKVKDRVLLRKI